MCVRASMSGSLCGSVCERVWCVPRCGVVCAVCASEYCLMSVMCSCVHVEAVACVCACLVLRFGDIPLYCSASRVSILIVFISLPPFLTTHEYKDSKQNDTCFFAFSASESRERIEWLQRILPTPEPWSLVMFILPVPLSPQSRLSPLSCVFACVVTP